MNHMEKLFIQLVILTLTHIYIYIYMYVYFPPFINKKR